MVNQVTINNKLKDLTSMEKSNIACYINIIKKYKGICDKYEKYLLFLFYWTS